MILDKVKELINSKIGMKRKFIYHGSRNQKDVFEGKIIKVFPAIFIILGSDGYIRSYSYNDVLISSLEILE